MPCILKKTVEVVLETGNDLLVQLKRNQPRLSEAVIERLVPQPPRDRQRRYDLGQHARLESRTVSVWPLPAGTGTEPWHDPFPVLIQVHRQTEVFNTRLKAWGTRQQTAYSLCTRSDSAATFARLIRAHWGLENRLHYGRDVTRAEDASRSRRNPGIFALLRSFALKRLRFKGVENIRLGLYDHALHFDHLLAYKGL